MFSSKDILFKSSIIMLCILFFLIIFSHNGVIDYYHLSKEKQVVLNENSKIKEKNGKLSRQINRLENDKEYIEHVAKHEFGMAGSDELVFRTISSRDIPEKGEKSKP